MDIYVIKQVEDNVGRRIQVVALCVQCKILSTIWCLKFFINKILGGKFYLDLYLPLAVTSFLCSLSQWKSWKTGLNVCLCVSHPFFYQLLSSFCLSGQPECLSQSLPVVSTVGNWTVIYQSLVLLSLSAAEFDSSLLLTKLPFLDSRMALSPPFLLTSLVNFVDLSLSTQPLNIEMHQDSVFGVFF